MHSEQFARLHELNKAYNERFGFPFILAVRGHDPASIIRCFEQRIGHEPAAEQQVALRQIGRIGAFRLADVVAVAPGAEIMAMIDKLARHSEDPHNLTCSYLSPAHRAVADQLRDWMLAAGMNVEIDAVGNVVGRLRCGLPGAKSFITGSHSATPSSMPDVTTVASASCCLSCVRWSCVNGARPCRSIWKSSASPTRKACDSSRRFSAAARSPDVSTAR